MTDNDIIKALECCSKITFSCDGCPLKHLKYSECYELVIRSTLNLINRQKAEIERLKSPCEMQIEVSKKLEATIRAEAVKEFAEKVNEHMCAYDIDNYHWFRAIERDAFNDLVKEMVGAESG